VALTPPPAVVELEETSSVTKSVVESELVVESKESDETNRNVAKESVETEIEGNSSSGNGGKPLVQLVEEVNECDLALSPALIMTLCIYP
jgi:hypothetical protein